MRLDDGAHVDEASAAHRAIDWQSRIRHHIGFAECVPSRMVRFAKEIDDGSPEVGAQGVEKLGNGASGARQEGSSNPGDVARPGQGGSLRSQTPASSE
jgi:hypothetical protein